MTTTHHTSVHLPTRRLHLGRASLRQAVPLLAIAALAPVVLLPVDVLVAVAGVGLLVALLVATADWAARDSFTDPATTRGGAARGDHASYDAAQGRADVLARLARTHR